jgi:A49-like RNA polymerase I associated factor
MKRKNGSNSTTTAGTAAAAAAAATAGTAGYSTTSSRSSSGENGTETTTTSTVRLKVAPIDATANPLVCSFPGGVPTLSTASPLQLQWRRGSRLTGKDETCHYTSINNTMMRTNSTRSSAQQPSKQSPIPQQPTQLAIGVYDRHTQTVTVHLAAERGTVFCLQQHVSSYTSALHHPASGTTDSSSATAAANYLALYEDFGSAKKRKVLASQQANRVTVADDAPDAFSGTTNMSESNRTALLERRAAVSAASDATSRGAALTESTMATEAATLAWRRALLPPFDETATRAADIYTASALCGGGKNSAVYTAIRRYVAHAAKSMGETSHVASSLWQVTYSPLSTVPTKSNARTWTPSVQELLDRLTVPSSEDGGVVVSGSLEQALCCAVVIHGFVTLYEQWHRLKFIPATALDDDGDDKQSRDSAAAARGKQPLETSHSVVPLVIRQRFLSEFGTPTSHRTTLAPGFAMSKANIDCCLVHILLLYLVAHAPKNKNGNGKRSKDGAAPPLQTSVQSIVSDLSLDTARAVKLLRHAGCTVTKSNGTNALVATLSAPLTFPPPRRKKAQS